MKALAFLMVLFSGLCFAESNAFKSEVTVYSGISFLETENESIPCIFCKITFPGFVLTQSADTGFLFGVKAGHKFNSNVEFEGNFGVAPSGKLQITNDIICPIGEICPLESVLAPVFFDEQKISTYYYDASFVYNFPLRGITPFVAVGVGGVSTDAEPQNFHDFALLFAGGVKFYFDRFGLRFEINDRVIPNHFLTDDTEHDLQVQYGLLFGF